MFKRIISSLLLAVLLLTCTACKNNKETLTDSQNTLSTYESVVVESVISEETKSEEISSETSEESKTSSKNNSSNVTTVSKETSKNTNASTPATSSKKPDSSKAPNSSSAPVSSSKAPASSVQSSTPSSKPTSTSSTDSHKHNYTDGSCTEPVKCTTCGYIKSEAEGHLYQNGHCIWCFESEEGFIKYYPSKSISFTLDDLNKIFAQSYTKPKNVIFMIGDGMGPNDITIAEKFGTGLKDYGFAFNKIPHNGFATTDSLDGTTDSAASATALATGTKTKNQYVGVDKDGNTLTNITEIAREYGKKVGVVTNDPMTGATPAAFLAHKISRADEDGIITSALNFTPDVYVGSRPESLKNAKEHLLEKYLVTNELNTINQILNTDNGAKKPYVGFLNGGYSNLHNYVSIALTRLKNENGFFLMIENTAADKAGHSNDMQDKIDAIKILDDAVITVLDFMKDNPDTLLIITSDHETGGVQLPAEGEKPSDALFTTTGHTSTNVRVFCLGYGSEYFNGKTVDNTDIAKFAISAVKGE